MNPFVFFGLANAPAWLVGLGRRLGRVGLPARCKTAWPFLRFVACVGYAARPLTRFVFGGWLVPKVAGQVPRGLQRYQPAHNGPDPTKRLQAHFEAPNFNERRLAGTLVLLQPVEAFKRNLWRSL